MSSLGDKARAAAAEQDREAAEETLAGRLHSAERRAHAAATETKALKAEVSSLSDEVLALRTELQSFLQPAHDEAPWLREPSQTEHRATLFTLLSDWHIGEVIDPAQVGGINAFNYEVARIRARRYFEKLVDLPRRYMGGRTYEGIVIGFGGDSVSGALHDELRETDEFSVLESCRKARDLILPGLRLLAEEYGQVHVAVVPGNHGRDSRKPRYKGRAEHNADIHVGYLLRDAVEHSGIQGVTFDIAEGVEVNFRIYDLNFRLEHLDEARGGNGVQGILAPLPRLVLKRQQQARGEQGLGGDVTPPDIIAGGHWHQLVDARGQGFLVNGCLKGFDEYARGQGYRPERPQQGLWVVSPENGLTDFVPIFCDDRKEEGW